MASHYRLLPRLILLIAILGLEGCLGFPPLCEGIACHTPFQPSADGPAAASGTTTIIPNLYLAYAGTQTTGHGAFGPGTARFAGITLEAFSADGNLDPTPTATSQPGYFLRPTTYASSSSNNRFLHDDGITFTITGEGDNDALIAWGRWFGYIKAPLTLITRGHRTLDDFVYVTGQLTPASGLPQSGQARYNFLGQPVAGLMDGDGVNYYTVVPHDKFRLSENSALSVLWGSATTKIGLDLAWNDNSKPFSSDKPQVYRMQTIGGLDNPGISQLSLRSGTATFGGTVNTFSDCPQGSTCSGSVEGFFVGPAAERAGLSYQVVDTAPGQPDTVISRVAAFAFSEFVTPPTATPPTPPPAPAPPPGPVVLAAPAATTIAYAMNDFGMDIQGPGAATQAADAQLNGFSLTASPAFFAPQRGTATTSEGGGDSLITWGRWTGGTFTGPLSFLSASDARRTFNANQGLHYVVGAETPVGGLPLSGTATFNLLGATNPTWGDGALAPGTFTGSMAVQWGGATSTTVGANFSVAMPGDRTYSIVTTGGLANPAASEIAIVAGTARFTGFMQAANPGGRAQCSAFCDVRVNGFFAGPAAERAGIAYTVGLGGSSAISGAAAFAKQ